MLRYVLKSSAGGKIRGRNWGGRACWAVIRVARRVGGREDSVFLGEGRGWVSWWLVGEGEEGGGGWGEFTAPGFYVVC